MGRFVDNLIAFRILRLLTQPFEETDAFRLGIIDKKGRELKRMQDLHTDAELLAYTLLHRLVYRLKRIIEKVPIENKKTLSYAAALALIKESLDAQTEPADLEYRYINRLKTDLTEEINWIQRNLVPNKIFTFNQFNEELASAAPANNAVSTAGIANPDPAPLFGKKVLRRKKNA
ncbi:MAG: hypothetical protein EB010_10975 [Acidimicrobiia bacterium]|jgi:hypothetical protein|nr:hypothetical protein [Actinomycetota bacterium]NDB05908.1 hypothetical protein [Acidimicrobiia bacterium]NDE59918.1 hypothetical protein [Acidimicrobiia bacterium]